MCYAIPGKIISIDKKSVTVEYFGEKKKAYNEFDKLKIGDYVYAQGGYVIKTIPYQEAVSILHVWKETFFELQDLDLRLSKLNLNKNNYNKNLLRILDKAIDGRQLNKQELLYLLNIEKDNELSLLYKSANFIRQKYLGNSCCIHGILEFSNYCNNSCYYCGISKFNKDLVRYKMTTDELCESASIAINKYGFQALVLQSGENNQYSINELVKIIKMIKSKSPVLIFLSIGETGIKNLKKLYDAGARGILLRFETSNKDLYHKIHPGQNFKQRIEHLKEAYKLGYLIITGSLIGIPGQTDEDILNDIYLAKKLKAEMYSFGPFIPHPATPYANKKSGNSKKILNTIAVTRFIDPKDAKILVTTAFETINPRARETGLMAGANSVMLNVTPDKFKKNYSLYPDRAHSNESIEYQINTTINLLQNLGRSPTDLGVS